MITDIKIHLADDHQVLIEGLSRLLLTKSEYTITGSSLNGKNLFEEVTNNNADILILDINMPIKDGFEVLKEFNQQGFPCKVIVLSSYCDPKIVEEVMRLGASGYLTKKCACENIIDAVETVINGKEYFCEEVHEKTFNHLSEENSKPSFFKSNKDSVLTGRELEIITLISLEYSGKEISKQLFISTNTVETHRKNIMRKLKTKNTIGLVKYAIRNDLIQS